MHYIIQSNIYKEVNFDLLIHALKNLDLSFETVKVLPFIDSYDFETSRKDVFIFGGVKLAEYTKDLNFSPGSLFGKTENFEDYLKYFRNHLLNGDSTIHNVSDELTFTGVKFIKPLDDNKLFNGKLFDNMYWNSEQSNLIYDKSYNPNLKILVSSPKTIYREVRLFIVDGKVVTGSQYMFGNKFMTSKYIGQNVIDYANEIIKIHNIADCYVMDIAETENGLKIVEFNCINASGFYESDVEKRLIALENFYN
jgi:hypothetical protein